MASGVFNLKQQLFALAQKAWSGPQKTNYVEYLVVAGGGSGGVGGGGAGGLLAGTCSVSPGSAITVTVGAGGVDSNGSVSVFGTISATGGGRTGANPGNGISGGSGGGAYINIGSNFPGQGILGQGTAGAFGSSSGSGGGGGGAGSAGMVGTTNYGGRGGTGSASGISGTVTTYAGGGGAYGSSAGGTGGAGGGGDGPSAGGTGSTGTTNTGGGGGGDTGGGGKAGGSGIVIIRYPNTFSDAIAVSNGTKTTANSCTIYTFTSSGSITF
jgi:hypothetical protein